MARLRGAGSEPLVSVWHTGKTAYKTGPRGACCP
jgi:hypothetical protein